MKTERPQVTNLKKITIHFQPDHSDGRFDTPDISATMTFIFGIGAGGLTDFEYALIDKQVGDEVSIAFQRDQVTAYFEHLAATVRDVLPERRDYRLNITIADVQAADNREVIQAMAKLAACESECGCGCGGHDNLCKSA